MTGHGGAAKNRRTGRARRLVLEVLERSPEPVSAEDIAQRLPDVHVSSVYRALAVLEEGGVVTHVHLGHGPAVYQLRADAAQVRHLVCEVCGRLVVVPVSLFAPVADDLASTYDFVVDTEHFAVVGRCTGCAPGPERT
jgi:Fur family transcriptional regulator, ferric uptake regulator